MLSPKVMRARTGNKKLFYTALVGDFHGYKQEALF